MNRNENKTKLVDLLTKANQDSKVIGIGDTADYLIKNGNVVVLSPANNGKTKDFLMMLLGTDMSGSEHGFSYEMADLILTAGFNIPPCEIGDTVYEVFEGGARKRTVYDFTYDGEIFRARFNPGSQFAYEFGRDIFFNKKDALAEWERRFG